ncbi:hypothetical protein DEA8626_02258 [Defluviimonas aquaemixtae]|uniref:CENP-V/GFA domain-containing protein n=1 Tax=Albidovulum aquaemixtae TaxID=1542388 RepID=A0A2R8B813_9RHOB|nr:GFA family protein [Defluviimonas aquaemixtae]SPH18716.1 hypothetical protein DEA8626_02258 [Defluviimonas aquaemixtae]
MEGRCTCGKIRYRLTDTPLFVHACHCTWCQRESGGPHAINAMIEADRVELLSGAPIEIDTPSSSGKGQIVLRCPDCHVALWSHYSGAGRAMAFVRVGTLDNPAACPPDIHIFTATRLPWYALPESVPAVPEYYRRSEHWPPESLARREALIARQAKP